MDKVFNNELSKWLINFPLYINDVEFIEASFTTK